MSEPGCKRSGLGHDHVHGINNKCEWPETGLRQILIDTWCELGKMAVLHKISSDLHIQGTLQWHI